jgi:aspartate kinase
MKQNAVYLQCQLSSILLPGLWAEQSQSSSLAKAIAEKVKRLSLHLKIFNQVMQVFKFGGASVSSTARIHNVASILRSFAGERLLVVISAMGKTTNALEKVVQSFMEGDATQALGLFTAIRQEHDATARALGMADGDPVFARLLDFYTEAEWLLHDKPVRGYDYYYDQLVCIGELLSTTIVSHFLNKNGVANVWMDVRDIIKTDDNFRDANINWELTGRLADQEIKPLYHTHSIVLTQGFIGSTDENESTTLGREGSDYTAAVFANLLDAEKQVIWKDVEGVMNADPKQFADAQLIAELNYDEVIEMAYYGAQVIHPKTIKPLQNKGIPLHVKCFLDASLPGTIIHAQHLPHLPPIIVWKQEQVLLHLHSKDFSFVGEKPMSRLYELLAEIKVKPNLVQSGAVSLMLCLDDRAEKIEKLAHAAAELFDVQVEKGLSLLTIRHYRPELLLQMTEGRAVVLQQQSTETVQVLMK